MFQSPEEGASGPQQERMEGVGVGSKGWSGGCPKCERSWGAEQQSKNGLTLSDSIQFGLYQAPLKI